MKIVTIVGARPQFIKAAALNRFINKNPGYNVKEVIIHTGQHYDSNMSDVFFKEMDIANPDYNLGIGSGSHGVQTGLMLQKIEDILLKEKPDVTLIYGDTNSTIAGALAASKLHIPVAHVESGLRSYNMLMPEEQNRVLTDKISQFLFCPTETAVNNLKDDGIYNGKKIKFFNQDFIVVENSGDIMYDAILYYQNRESNIDKLLSSLNLCPKEYILATIHRAENTDDCIKLKSIFNALSKIPEKIILALHPRTKKFIYEYKINISSNVSIINPIGYIDMINLEKNAKVILTDSGGVQKEAYFLTVPCITLREETEWVETVKDKWNFLAGSSEEIILKFYENIINTNYELQKQHDHFGNGDTAEKILTTLIKYL